MKNIYLILLAATFILAQPAPVAAQNNVKNKQVYFEFGGPGLMSVNFDSRFDSNSRRGLGYRVGIGAISTGCDYRYYPGEATTITFPLSLNYVFGKQNSSHAFEVGAGCTFVSKPIEPEAYNQSYAMVHLSFMYRRMPVNGGFTWRIGLTPLVVEQSGLFPVFTAGIGYAF